MKRSTVTEAEEMGWRILGITKDNVPKPLDFSFFDLRLIAVGDYVRDNLANTSYGISGAEDYSKNPRGNYLGMFSIYNSTHSKDGLMALLDIGNVAVLNSGDLIVDCITTAPGYESLRKMLVNMTAAKKVTNDGNVVDEYPQKS